MHTNETLDWTLYQPTLTFPNERMALMTDGQGYMALFKTGDRTQQKPWEVITTPAMYLYYTTILCVQLLLYIIHVLYFLDGDLV